MLGEFTGSGLRNRLFLVRRRDGQVITLTDLLVNIVDAADGARDIPAIADRVRTASGRPVSADNVEYLLTTKLIPLGVIADGGGATATPRVTPLLGLAGRRTLVPAPAVGVLARALAPLFRPAVVTGVLTILIMMDAWLVASTAVMVRIHHVLASPALILAVLGGTLVSMIFHECGHAAACHYGGGRPGVIGCGMYLLWPAFYTDVTDAYRLDRTARLRTDLGGVYFNAIFAAGLGIAYAIDRADALVVVILLVHLEAFQQLVPVLRLDGYYILSDLAGVPDLFARIGPVLSTWLHRGRERCRRWTRTGGRHRRRNHGRNRNRIPDPRVTALTRRAQRTITAWVLVMAPLLVANLVLIIMIAPGVVTRAVTSVRAQATLVARSAGAGEPTAMIAGVADAAVLALPAVGIAFLLLRLAGAGVRAAVVAGRGGPGRAAAAVLGVIVMVGAVLTSWLR